MPQPQVSAELPVIALLALGANMPSHAGDPAETLASALDDMAQTLGVITKKSKFYSTPCFPVGAGPDYVNSAAMVKTKLTPEAFLVAMHEIESRYGRVRTERWGMRTLDIDLLAYGDLVCPDVAGFRAWSALDTEEQKLRAPDQLILPHPRMQDRAFVLVPLAEIAPHWQHPVLDLSVAEMLAGCSAQDVAEVTAQDT